MISTTDFKRGVKIEYDNKAWTIMEFQHVNPGKGAAFTRTKLKNLETGRVVEVSFRSGDKVGIPDVQTRQMQYLYTDGANFNFMDQASYDQISLTAEEVGDAKDYMLENSVIAVTYYNGKPVAVEPPRAFYSWGVQSEGFYVLAVVAVCFVITEFLGGRDRMLARWVGTVQSHVVRDVKIACYLSAEFLMGPQLGNNLVNLGIESAAREAMHSLGQELDELLLLLASDPSGFINGAVITVDDGFTAG